MILVPWQDIPLPDGPPSEEDIADTGQGIIDWVMLFPTVVVAVIAAMILYNLWKNPMIRVLFAVILAVVVTIMVVNGT